MRTAALLLLGALMGAATVWWMARRESPRHNPANTPQGWTGWAPPQRTADGNVWRLLQSSPGFKEGMARAQADFDAGRIAPFRHAFRCNCPESGTSGSCPLHDAYTA